MLFFAKNHFPTQNLLADAKVLKDIAQDLLVGDDAQNLTQMGEAETEVLTDEVTRKTRMHSIKGAENVLVSLVEGLLVTQVGDKHVVVLDTGYGCKELLMKVSKTSAVEGLELGGLVGDTDDGLVGTHVQLGEGDTGFVHEDDDVGTTGCCQRTLNAQLLDAVVGVAQACRIDEAELGTTGSVGRGEVEGVLDGVACGTLDVAHDGLVLLKELVEEGGLAYVGSPDDGHGNAVLDGVARSEGGRETGDFLLYVLSYAEEFRAVGKLQFLVVGEVEFEFEQGGEVEEAFAEVGEAVGDAAPHLLHGYPMLRGITGGYEVSHGLSLREVHLAVEEGALGELPGASQTAASLDEELQDALEDVG